MGYKHTIIKIYFDIKMDCQVVLFPVEDIIYVVNTFFELSIDEDVDTCSYCIKVTKPNHEGIYVPFTISDENIQLLYEHNVFFIKFRELTPNEYLYLC